MFDDRLVNASKINFPKKEVHFSKQPNSQDYLIKLWKPPMARYSSIILVLSSNLLDYCQYIANRTDRDWSQTFGGF